MELDTDALNRLMSSKYDRRSTHPAPDHAHLEEFRRKEFSEADVAEVYHENTKYTEHTTRSDQSTMSHFVHDETMQFALSKLPPDYEDRERIDLPSPDESLDVDVADAVRHRRTVRSYSGDGISLDRLSTLLYYSCGATGRLSAPEGVENLGRAYPSGGGLYPVEIYFAVLNAGEDLDEGLYYYVPDDHALRVLERGDGTFADEVAELFTTGGGLDPTEAALSFALTAAFWRTKAKYGPRGYRFALQESGHVVQNVQLVATAMGLASAPFAAAHEDEVNDFLGVDGVDEAAVYTGFVGVPDPELVGSSADGGSRR